MKKVPGTPFIVRDWDPMEEQAMVLASWIHGVQRAKWADHLGCAAKHIATGHDTAIKRWMGADLRGRVSVAIHEEAPDLVIGWMAWTMGGQKSSAPIVHYIYVRERYRRSRVASSLLESTIGPGWRSSKVLYTHKMSRLAKGPDGRVPAIPPNWEFSVYPFFHPSDGA